MGCNFNMLQSFSATCFGPQQTNHPAQVGLYLSSYFRRPRRYLVFDAPLGQLISDKAGKGLRLPGADTTELVHVLRGRVNRKLLGSCRSRILVRACGIEKLWSLEVLLNLMIVTLMNMCFGIALQVCAHLSMTLCSFIDCCG